MKKLVLLILSIAFQLSSFGQELAFNKVEVTDTVALANQMQQMASKCDIQKVSELDLFKFQLIGGNFKEAITTIQNLLNHTPKKESVYLELYQHYVTAKASSNFSSQFKKSYNNYLVNSDDFQVLNLDDTLISRDGTDYFVSDFKDIYNRITTKTITEEIAQNLVKKYFLKSVFESSRKLVFEAIKEDHNRRYTIQDSIVLPMEDGAEVSVVVIERKGSGKSKKPAILIASIYAGTDKATAMLSASKGYVGVISNTRGKRLSKGEVKPLEYESRDVYQVIDWISKQPWSNQKVGMCGGSYNGFTQWAAMKHKVHPALKTIVPMVAIAPGIDYPMENNVLHNYSYSWNFYVTNNKFLDFEASGDYKRWNDLKNTWYNSGIAFNKLDSIDGQENKLWNAYMKHPGYDEYWKKMIPYKREFEKINIPILTITGYYDDSQRGAMYYFNEHHKYANHPNHYLLVGPYDHWTAQTQPEDHLRNYKLDASALLNIRYNLVYQWFDYILKGHKKPDILKDKVNFQVMDTDSWMHKPSLAQMTNDTLSFYLSSHKQNGFHALQAFPNQDKVNMTVDYKDREQMSNTQYYPWPLERDAIQMEDGLVFTSEVLKEDVIINGSFFGELEVSINKKDVDFSVIAYQLKPDGQFFHLSYYIGRASYAEDREHRKLLSPHQLIKIPFQNSKLISKKIEKGSRIVFVVNVNKNNSAQINYGTGKDVNSESILDANTPLNITFTGQSCLSIPIWKTN